MLDNKIYLILGIGTDIGKTFLVEKLVEKYQSAKIIKPIATGFLKDDKNSDTARIQRAMQKNHLNFSAEEITPFAYEKASSVHLVAEIEYQQIVNFCINEIDLAIKKNNHLFIESAGGVMSPINYHKTFLDLAKDLNISVLLVSSNYLGAISHTLTSIEVLKAKKINIEKIFINEDLIAKQNFFKNYDDIDFVDMAKTIEEFSKIPVLSMKNL